MKEKGFYKGMAELILEDTNMSIWDVVNREKLNEMTEPYTARLAEALMQYDVEDKLMLLHFQMLGESEDGEIERVFGNTLKPITNIIDEYFLEVICKWREWTE